MASKTLCHIINDHGLIDDKLVRRNGASSGLFPRINKTSTIGLLVLCLCLSASRASSAEEIRKGKAHVNIFGSEEELSVSLDKYIADLSNQFVHERGFFTLVLTGDSIINSLRKLLEPPYFEQLDWSKWYVFWADERAVSKSDPLSNYKLDEQNFLSKAPIPKDNVISINDKLTVEEEAEDYENRLRQLVQNGVIAKSNATGFPIFDFMLLGLGHNGHIASLFPNRPQLIENKKWITYIKDSPKPPPQRITMTFPVINSASQIVFVVTGEDIANTVSAVLDGNRTTVLPATMISPSDGSELKWFLDNEAASMLKMN